MAVIPLVPIQQLPHFPLAFDGNSVLDFLYGCRWLKLWTTSLKAWNTKDYICQPPLQLGLCMLLGIFLQMCPYRNWEINVFLSHTVLKAFHFAVLEQLWHGFWPCGIDQQAVAFLLK